jgi:hypothetical protein
MRLFGATMNGNKGPRLLAHEKQKDLEEPPPAVHTPGVVPNARVQKNGFVADIVISNYESAPQIFHYVIQHEGSTEIVHWGQELSFQRALESIEQYLAQFNEGAKPA